MHSAVINWCVAQTVLVWFEIINTLIPGKLNTSMQRTRVATDFTYFIHTWFRHTVLMWINKTFHTLLHRFLCYMFESGWAKAWYNYRSKISTLNAFTLCHLKLLIKKLYRSLTGDETRWHCWWLGNKVLHQLLSSVVLDRKHENMF